MRSEKYKSVIQKIDFTKVKEPEEEYYHSAVLMLLIPIHGEYHIVFEKRSENIRQGGEISFPGGKVDQEDPTIEYTAKRETLEELGIPMDQIQILSRLKTVKEPLGAKVDGFIGVADISLEDMSPNLDEVEEVFTLPLSYFVENQPERYSVLVQSVASYEDEKTGEEVVLLPVEKLGLPKRYKDPWGTFEKPIYVYETQYGPIWGLTAKILYQTMEQIKKQP